MKKIIISNGLIAGAITFGWVVISLGITNIAYSDYGEILGYASMIVAFAFVYVGVRKIKEAQGRISFGKAFLNGLYIALVASGVYVIGWMIMDADNAFIGAYTRDLIQSLEDAGASAEEISAKREEMAAFEEMYGNPIVKAGMTLMEILPVGILVSLISAAVLRTKG